MKTTVRNSWGARLLAPLGCFAVALTLLLAPFPAGAEEGDVDMGSVLRLGNSAELVGDGISDAGAELYHQAMDVPPDDNHKWFITVVTMRGCAPCERLKRDFASDPHLRSLVNTENHKVSWAHYNVYDKDDRSQAWRFAKLRITVYPTVLVQPPINKRYGDPSTVVAQINGYSGDGKALQRKIVDAIRRYCARLSEQPETYRLASAVSEDTPARAPAAGEHGQRTPPWRPRPKDEPAPAPAPDPAPPPSPDADPFAPYFPATPSIPHLPPEIPPRQPEAPPIPKSPQIVVVTDGSEEEGDLAPLQDCVARLKEFHRGKRFKVRDLDFEEASAIYPVTEDELPAVLVTDDGKIEAKILGRILPAIEPPVPTKIVEVEKPVEVEVEKPVTSISQVPWDVILQIVLTGTITPGAVIAIILWVVRFIRQRRKAAGTAILPDGAFDVILERSGPVLEQIVERIVERVQQRRNASDKQTADPAAK